MKKKSASKSAKRAKSVKSPTPSGADASETPVNATQSPAAAAAEPRESAKPARPTRKRPAKKTSIRYSPEAKAEIIRFVRDHDAVKGRGGKSAAVRKFGVTALTLSKWMKGSKSARKPATAKANAAAPTPRGRPGRVAQGAKVAGPAAGGIGATLARMLEIQGQINAMKAEFEDLKARI